MINFDEEEGRQFSVNFLAWHPKSIFQILVMADKIGVATSKKTSRGTGKKLRKRPVPAEENLKQESQGSLFKLTASTTDFITSVDLKKVLDTATISRKRKTKRAIDKVFSLRKKVNNNLCVLAAKNLAEAKRFIEEKRMIDAIHMEEFSEENIYAKALKVNSSSKSKKLSKHTDENSEDEDLSVSKSDSLQLDFLRKLAVKSSPTKKQSSLALLDSNDFIKPKKNVKQIMQDNAKILNHPLTKSKFKEIPGVERVLSVTYPDDADDDADASNDSTSTLEDIHDKYQENPYTVGKKTETIAYFTEERTPRQSKTSRGSSHVETCSKKASTSSEMSQHLEKVLHDIPDVQDGESITSIVTKFKYAKSQIINIIDQIKNKTLVYVDEVESKKSNNIQEAKVSSHKAVVKKPAKRSKDCEEMEKCKDTLQKIKAMRKNIENDKRKVEKYARDLKAKTDKEMEELNKDVNLKKEVAKPKKKKNGKSVHELYKADKYDSCMDLVDKLLHVKNCLYPMLTEIQQQTSNIKAVGKNKKKGVLCSVSKLSFAKATEAGKFFQTLGKGENKFDLPPYLTEMIVNNMCYADCLNRPDLPEEDRVYVDAETLRQLLNFYDSLGSLIEKLQQADAFICNRGCIEACPGPSECQGKICSPFKDDIIAITTASENMKAKARERILGTDSGSKNQKMAFFTHI